MTQNAMRLGASARRCRRQSLPFVSVLFVLLLLTGREMKGQAPTRIEDRIAGYVDPARTVALPNHHPQWAKPENATGLVSADLPLNDLTLVLSRSAEQEKELEAVLSELQNPASPQYHHWLTPVEMGTRFGLSDHDIASLSDWLQSQGLHVRWISPSRTFIGFGGAAGAVSRAFRTQLHTYRVEGTSTSSLETVTEGMSIASDPMVPLALAPAIKAIRGLYTVEDRPLHALRVAESVAPRLTAGNDHFLTPQDFKTIYGNTGIIDATGQTIGIVGESRTNFADFDNFRNQTEVIFSNPQEVVPTAYGGIDPGPAYTAPPTTKVSLEAQSEATLDVAQAASLANGAQTILVVATPASGGIEADAQYLVQTTPVPAQVMSISFGACESLAGQAGVAYWDTLFKQAAAEGISVLVASGDSGASGCDASFATPPAAPAANSPNYICSSSYATCVGGTEFNDSVNPSLYWSTVNGSDLSSAEGYIPEGGWNEPQNTNNGFQVAASGGGVSSVIATPAWQTGTGVPSARTGRYTPDVAFSASSHDGYFGCFAAGGGSCSIAPDGSLPFVVFSGTSAAAPAMAAVAAVLNASLEAPQGSLNPQLYQLAVSTPSIFHDVTVASSGVSSCTASTPSICNNSIPGPTSLAGGQPGYLVTPGYDEVTGLGSIDIFNLVNNYSTAPTLVINPHNLTFPSQLVGYSTSESVEISNAGLASLDSLSVTVSGANAGDFVPVLGSCPSTLEAKFSCVLGIDFTPTASGARTATATITSSNGVNSSQTVTLSGRGTTTPYTPVVQIAAPNITAADPLPVNVQLFAPAGAPVNSVGIPFPPTGTVTLTISSYQSAPVTLTTQNGAQDATFTIPAGTIPAGNDIVTATYQPDSASSPVYRNASGTAMFTVTPIPVPGFAITGNPVTLSPGATTGNTSVISIASLNGFSGNVLLTAEFTAAPANAQDLPSLSFGTTSPAAVTANPGHATLTVGTTAATNSSFEPAKHISWYTAGGTSVACLLLLLAPARLRRWRSILPALLLLACFSGGITACGGGGSKTSGAGSPPASSDPGTTPGSYTVAVTGTSAGITETATVALTVN